MKKFALGFIAFVLVRCNEIDAKIEGRNKNSVFLVNSSKTKTFEFTVKTTEIQDDTIYSYSTELITLSPGDEKYLGYRKAVSPIEYPMKEIIIFKAYQIDQTNKKNNQDKNEMPPFLDEGQKVKLSDTIINGELIRREYIYGGLSHRLYELKHNPFLLGLKKEPSQLLKDTLIMHEPFLYESYHQSIKDMDNPYPVKRFSYKYKVTGQTEIKNSTSNKKQ